MTSVPAFGIPQKLNRMQQISSQANDTKTDIALLFRTLGVTLKKSMSWADHVSTKINQRIEVLHGGHVACQEQYNIIPMGQNFHSNAKHFHCSWHATWPPCKTSIGLIRRLRKLLPLQAKVTFVKYSNPPSFWLRRQHYGEHIRITCLSQKGDYFFLQKKAFEVSPSRKPVGELAIKNIRS